MAGQGPIFGRAGRAGKLAVPLFFGLVLTGLALTDARAHKVSSVSLISHLDTGEKTYLLDAAMEVVPSEDAELNDQIPPEEAARIFAEEYLAIFFDEAEQSPELEIRIEESSDAETPEALQRKQVLVQMKGSIPDGAKDFLLYLDPTCPMAVVMVVIKDNQPSRRMQVILAGEYSRPVNVQPLVEGDPFAKGDPAPGPAGKGEAEPPEGDAKGEEVPGAEKIVGAFGGGWVGVFEVSLLPALLVVCVFLPALSRKSVFPQVAGVLLGHSLGIALALLELWSAGEATETILAVLVALLALDSLIHQGCRYWRVAMIAVAGLFCGQLVAGFTETGRALLAMESADLGEVIEFVAGSELALVVVGLVVATVFLLLGRFDWYRKSVIQPVAALLVAYGIFVAVERFL